MALTEAPPIRVVGPTTVELPLTIVNITCGCGFRATSVLEAELHSLSKRHTLHGSIEVRAKKFQ